MFSLEMLAAGHGDCLWLEYGNGQKTHRMLVDGGTQNTASALRRRLESVPIERRRFELLVVTHVDADHLDGIYQLLQQPPDGLHFDEVWFNGYRHAEEAASYLGALTAEYFSRHLEAREKQQSGYWNGAFDGKAVMAPSAGNFPRHCLSGGLRLTVLGPTREALVRLGHEWEETLAELKKKPGELTLLEPESEDTDAAAYLGGLDVQSLAKRQFTEDKGAPNGSSIVLLAEYDGQRVLLCGDAFPSGIAAAVKRIDDGGRLNLTAVKAPHHGSRKNNSNELYSSLSAKHFLLSTNGAHFKHPDPEAIARMLYNKGSDWAILHFNYRSQFNTIWDAAAMAKDWKYEARYPAEGLVLSL